ncbi:hypothetical protein [Streptomyces sp. YS415]|uniref:hypothetical protein n=1 Tax=Streptomyces sp. YS415 TaxID=2944806 RepID=UPI0020218517|nr:hypothetical protein [Streptomyces sp. YS415]MCL7430392.1 hypothetical protein [Streptomyces sp. YS415]
MTLRPHALHDAGTGTGSTRCRGERLGSPTTAQCAPLQLQGCVAFGSAGLVPGGIGVVVLGIGERIREGLPLSFRPLGLTQQQVRQDRILDEARESAAPLRLMRLFGISDGTAMRYVSAARLERTAKLPR